MTESYFETKRWCACSKPKSWLEGAGFWDVKELVIRLLVEVESPTGKLLLHFMRYQTEAPVDTSCLPCQILSPFPSEVPTNASQLATEFPQPNFDEIRFGNFYINMHIVSGRKPRDPRPGDMLRDDTRQGMTSISTDAVKRLDQKKSNQ
jgi:hypothetical protein